MVVAASRVAIWVNSGGTFSIMSNSLLSTQEYLITVQHLENSISYGLQRRTI